MSRVCIFLADGFEEVEALTPVDLLRRAGIEVTTVSMNETPEVTGRSRITVVADALWADAQADTADMLVLPGGQPGVKNLGAHEGLTTLLKEYADEGKLLAAICAAPTIFGALGIVNGKCATCYPGHKPRRRHFNPLRSPSHRNSKRQGRGRKGRRRHRLRSQTLIQILCPISRVLFCAFIADSRHENSTSEIKRAAA